MFGDYNKRYEQSGFSRIASFATELSGPVSQDNRLFVNIGSAMLCILVADIALQALYDRRQARQQQREWSYNYWRTVRLLIVGGILAAIGHRWYNVLDEQYATSGLKDSAAKVVLDEVIMAPVIITSYIFALGLLEGHKLKNVYQEWKEKFSPIYYTDLMMWPAAQFVHSFLMPVHYRVPFINFCTFVWNIYLIQAKHKQFVQYKVPVKEQHVDLELTNHELK